MSQNLFLVGGFGASPYLQEELRESLRLRHIVLHQPNTDKSCVILIPNCCCESHSQ